jgi:hypothetical protein
MPQRDPSNSVRLAENWCQMRVQGLSTHGCADLNGHDSHRSLDDFPSPPYLENIERLCLRGKQTSQNHPSVSAPAAGYLLEDWRCEIVDLRLESLYDLIAKGV